MEQKIIYIYNPVSGTKNKISILKKIEAATTLKKIYFEILATNKEGNYGFIKDKVIRNHITDIVIIGGDGTVSQVTNALRDCKTRFGIIPAGSGNGLANAAGIPKNLNHALKIIFKHESKKTDAFFINNQYSCMLSGLGFDAAVAHKFAIMPKRGLPSYLRQTFLHFFKATTYPFEITFNGISFHSDAFFISIANSNQFGNKFTIAPKAKLNDGLLDIVVVQKMNKFNLVLSVLKQVTGNYQLQYFANDNTKRAVLYFQASELTIKNFNLAPLHIDGDPCATSNELDIKIIKDAFELSRP